MKILLVDDEEMVRKPFERFLSESGHEVITAGDGVEALEILAGRPADLIITDLRMPRMDGLELLRRVKVLKPDQDLIIVTGYAEMDSTVEALRLGAANYLMKPVNLEELAIAVDRIEKQQARDRKLKEHETRLVQARKMADLGLLAGGVAHEINNPNTFVRGNVQTLQRFWPTVEQFVRQARQAGVEPSAKLDFILEETPKIIEAMLEGTNRIKKIVEAMASFTGSDRDRPLIPVNINACVHKALDVLAEDLETVELKVNLQSNLPPVGGLPEELVDVTVELLKNSVKALHGRPEPRIRITTESPPHLVRLMVEDNGPGIKAEDQSRIFSPFFSGDPRIGRPGLGLSKVYAAVRRFGGETTLSSNESQGTAFIISLPVLGERWNS